MKEEKMYGNLDSEKICEFPAKAKDNFVVRHSRHVATPSGQTVEDPGSVEVAIYSPDNYDKLFNNTFGNTGVALYTKVTGKTSQVLHDPTHKSETRGRKKKSEIEENSANQNER